ncbi:MAG: hypothetical protein NT163_04220 [Chlorobiales bacterium]|nr:hypothetical protein [Chlorobiales bacterium]
MLQLFPEIRRGGCVVGASQIERKSKRQKKFTNSSRDFRLSFREKAPRKQTRLVVNIHIISLQKKRKKESEEVLSTECGGRKGRKKEEERMGVG